MMWKMTSTISYLPSEPEVIDTLSARLSEVTYRYAPCRHQVLQDPMIHHRQKTVVSDLTFQTGMSSLMDFGTPDSTLDKE
ncbi:kazrin [Triplophysa rosa]|uniref:Kazrin n=1 Tax=Triplophysa rosa TaxID=992332 RepID=A0A9W7WBU8_TRIRA|nr:kazrin [Triplophysa rosa]